MITKTVSPGAPIHAQWRHPVVRYIPIDVHNMVWRTGPGLVSYGL